MDFWFNGLVVVRYMQTQTNGVGIRLPVYHATMLFHTMYITSMVTQTSSLHKVFSAVKTNIPLVSCLKKRHL